MTVDSFWEVNTFNLKELFLDAQKPVKLNQAYVKKMNNGVSMAFLRTT